MNHSIGPMFGSYNNPAKMESTGYSPSPDRVSSFEQTTPTGHEIKTVMPTAPQKGSRPTNYYNGGAGGAPNNTHDDNDTFGTYNLRKTTFSGGSSVHSRSSVHSSVSQYSTSSILENRAFAPPPKFPENLNVMKPQFFGEKREILSTLPSFDQVKHSGNLMSRFSMKSMVTKKWKYAFWIAYGNNQILFFRSRADFEEWVSNPFLTKEARDALVKLDIDFINDLYKSNAKGYRPTSINLKDYAKHGMLYHFKLEFWTEFGPSVKGSFSSKNENDVYCLRRIMAGMIEKSPQQGRGVDESNGQSGSSAYDSDAYSIHSSGRGSNKSGYQSGNSGYSAKSAPTFKETVMDLPNDLSNRFLRRRKPVRNVANEAHEYTQEYEVPPMTQPPPPAQFQYTSASQQYPMQSPTAEILVEEKRKSSRFGMSRLRDKSKKGLNVSDYPGRRAKSQEPKPTSGGFGFAMKKMSKRGKEKSSKSKSKQAEQYSGVGPDRYGQEHYPVHMRQAEVDYALRR